MTTTAQLWRSAARTETGKVRRRNEDAVLALPERGLWAVADGMGGHQNGALASRLIIEQLAEPLDGDLAQRLAEVRKRLHELNRLLRHELTVSADHPDPVIGSTVVALLIEANRAACIWAGDSRCYLWRGRRLYQLSRDHSLLQQLIDQDQLSPSEAARHPAAHALTQAIGASDQLKLEILELDLLPGDAFLLCSDGLYQSLSADELSAALNLPSPQLSLNRLVEHALAGPARDNLSAVVVRQ
ncbi:PP2C family protein-serine/threonine phosphatase [Pseudomonas sp. 5P_3.1_Bac2]|uniref:PP2C family protein-serine/threonine phosphatase n=1 Tax=Pseudomonas sp. 5P_3.1_Bac2 TaxID=2971617 RepID=UPI0021C74B35|nr:PP2C family serine/threonine-protein phosphatase [Pseudomonas sp. 5P_3.1_Bac2]MCU1718984.1 serine/threonine-protein phosphatase [Pseudomonas sp. 5P_3.1_Bac2]